MEEGRSSGGIWHGAAVASLHSWGEQQLSTEGLSGVHEVSHLERAGCGGRFRHRPQSLGLDHRGSSYS